MTKGTIAVLDLPVGTALSMDGFSMILKRSDFVGISEIPTGDFHLVTVRQGGGGSTPSIILHGFVLYGDEKDCLLARKYDPMTEEVAMTTLDDLTVSNLHQQLQNHQIDVQRLIPYHKLIITTQWQDATKYISASLLRKRGFQHGDKILPGAYIGDENVSEQPSSTILDGNSITYPPIPCIDQSISIHKTKHQGTKLYLSRLSPTDRSLIYLAIDPAHQALSSVLEKEYNNEWGDMLGDLQLAFVLFIHLHCFSSLEHWYVQSIQSQKNVEAIIHQKQFFPPIQARFNRHVIICADEWNLRATRHVHSVTRDFTEATPICRKGLFRGKIYIYSPMMSTKPFENSFHQPRTWNTQETISLFQRCKDYVCHVKTQTTAL